MPEITITYDIAVECTCGNVLEATYNARMEILSVEPCEACLSMAREEGLEEGRNE